MALSVHPPPHATWDRTLPNPAALLSTGAEPRRSSSLLQHHISSDQFMTPAADETGRHAAISYSALLQGNEKDQVHGEQTYLRQRQDSTMSEDSMTDISSEDAGPVENPPGYCLCVPEPKIPRPRNAFILYRQHQHAGVVAQHPGLPNPDISKIIGEQWRQLSLEDKNEWKALAEQEKARHSQQFPDYRYRPRRSGKFQSADASQAPATHPTNCSKCGGKTMNPPPTPHYTTYEQTAVTPVVALSRGQKRGYAEAHGPPPPRQPSLVQVAPPPYPVPVPYGYQPRRESVHYTAQPNLGPPPQQRMVVEDPEAKRRRMNASYQPRPVYDQQYYDRERAAYHRESIARPMAPPPVHRPSHPGPQTIPPRGSQPLQRKDPSLTLPPLKTNAQSKPLMSPAAPPKSEIETTIMSFPVLTKLKTLSSITRSLAVPGPRSTPQEVRGVIIAIEGLDSRKVNDMTTSLTEQLGKEGKFYVRTFVGPNPYQTIELNRRASTEGKIEALSHAKYYNFMSEWHKLNQEVVSFVTQKPTKVIEIEDHDHNMADAQSPEKSAQKDKQNIEGPYERPGTKRSPISAISPGTVEQTSQMALDTPVTKPATEARPQSPPVRVTRSRVPQAALEARAQAQAQAKVPSPPPPPPPASTRPITPPPPASPGTSHDDISNLIPVALIPHYQLTTVDTCSMALPITDNYDPLTHWRWHATLWRGCTGPDISVVIHGDTEEDLEPSSNDGKKAPPILAMRNSGPESQLHRTTNMNMNAAPGPSASAPPANPMHAPPPPPPKPLQTTTATAPSSVPVPFSVDVRLQDYRAVIVRTGTKVTSPRRVSNANATINERSSMDEKMLEKDNENWEKAKRRVGFEVAEWMRR